MVSETLVSAMLTSSLTGAGLVIAFYALISKMSDSIFSCRFELLDDKQKKFDQIRRNPESFNKGSYKKSSSRLEELDKEIDAFSNPPKYLTKGVAITFVLFILSAISSAGLLLNYGWEIEQTIASCLTFGVYATSIISFLIIGLYGLNDVNETMKTQFKKLSEKKTELKEEIKQAPNVAEIFHKVNAILQSFGIMAQTTAMFKIDGKIITPDFYIPSKNGKTEFFIELMSNPNVDRLFKRSFEFEKFKSERKSKSILIITQTGNNFSVAKPYWDYIIDFSKEDVESRLRDIILK